MRASASNWRDRKRKPASALKKKLLFSTLERSAWIKFSAAHRKASAPLDQKAVGGLEKNSIIVASLVDTNILVYRCDSRDPRKREVAKGLLRRGMIQQNLQIPHQALLEFVSVVTRIGPNGQSILPRGEAWRQAEDFLIEFPILYPNAHVVRTAMRGMAAYGLSWFDAHLWAYAEHYGLPEIVSEDFEHGRLYGGVRVRNPFL